MTNLRVVILPGGKTAKEVNSLGKSQPEITSGDFFIVYGQLRQQERWQEAEDNLRTFEIENTINASNNKFAFIKETETKTKYIDIIEGKEYSAELLDNGKVKIL